MKLVYGLLDTLTGQEADYCFIDKLPEGKGLSAADAKKPSVGKPASDVFPPDAQVTMSKRFGGTLLPDFVSNNSDLLIVSKRVKQVFARVNKGKTEYIPISIVDRKGKIVSKDYFIANPIGMYDVLDTKATHLGWDPFHLHRIGFALDPQKLKKAPEFFRIKGHPVTYVISRKIAGVIRKFSPKYKNLHYLEIYELDSN